MRMSDEQESFGYATCYMYQTLVLTHDRFTLSMRQAWSFIRQIVPEISDEPDYDAALTALSNVIA